MAERFATLTFTRDVAAPVETLWQAWTAPAARALWAPPAPGVTIEFLQTDNRPGGREVSLCKVAGQPDVRAQVDWLDMQPPRRSVNSELVSCKDEVQGAALVTAELSPEGQGSRLALTVQLASLDMEMTAGYQQGYTAAADNLKAVAERTMIIARQIKAPVAAVWGAWLNPATLPQWWGPEGFSCKTTRIDLRAGGEWVFDMIAPDGTVFPNHHRYGAVLPLDRLEYALHWGENGPLHARAWAQFTPVAEGTQVTLGMVFASAEECANARGFGAEALGLQTLGKLARFIGA